METERDQYRNVLEPIKRKLRELEESESGVRIALEKKERDNKTLEEQNKNLTATCEQANAEVRKSENALKCLDTKFKVSYK